MFQEASPSSYYAIFDGHAGHDAAAYSSAHLHQFLAENKHFVANPEQALLDAFCKTDALFIDKCNVEVRTHKNQRGKSYFRFIAVQQWYYGGVRAVTT